MIMQPETVTIATDDTTVHMQGLYGSMETVEHQARAYCVGFKALSRPNHKKPTMPTT